MGRLPCPALLPSTRGGPSRRGPPPNDQTRASSKPCAAAPRVYPRRKGVTDCSVEESPGAAACGTVRAAGRYACGSFRGQGDRPAALSRLPADRQIQAGRRTGAIDNGATLASGVWPSFSALTPPQSSARLPHEGRPLLRRLRDGGEPASASQSSYKGISLLEVSQLARHEPEVIAKRYGRLTTTRSTGTQGLAQRGAEVGARS
jgi:hypothetical protein